MKSWAQEDQPREKLVQNGRKSLSNAELMAILIRTGRRGKSALEVCKEILADYDNDLGRVGQLEVNDLVKYKGLGKTKAITLIAALELGERRMDAGPIKRSVVSSSSDAYHYMRSKIAGIRREEFWIILLNRRNSIITEIKISTGGISATVVDPRLIFKHCIEYLASGMILVHNHPSGNLRPSQQDKALTTKLVSGALLLDVKILDHLIVTNGGYFSFSDEGLME